MKKRSIIPLLLVLLFSYIIAQLFWWAYLITQLTKVVYEGSDKLSTRVTMIWGEGIVFSILLFLGFIITYRAYQKEMALARQQKNFLLSITHELKTPIASLRLFLETLQSRQLSDEQKQKFIQSALMDTDRLNGLIENILITSKFEQGQQLLQLKPCNISVLSNEVLSGLEKSIGKNHILKLDIENDILIAMDEIGFVSILTNLFENAVKYAPTNSTIFISLKKENGKIILVVKDEGDGISDSDKQKIFQKFYRIQSEETRSTKGTGLGLYIVKNYIELLNGTIIVENNLPKGSVFKIQIPIEK